MQVLMWAAMYPDIADSIISMASGAAVPVTGIAWHILGRKIIETDQRFHGGDYYDDDEPLRGLQVARMLGHMTYLSAQVAATEVRAATARRHAAVRDRLVLRIPGQKFATLYDANSYIRVQAAMDEMDLEEQYGDLESAFATLARPHAARVVRHGLALPAVETRARGRGDALARTSTSITR